MQEEKFQLKVNGRFEWNLTKTQVDELDFVTLPDGDFHVLQNGKSFKASLVSLDFSKKVCVLKLDGALYEVAIADQFDQLVDKMGLSKAITHKVGEIKAPMPGLVLSIAVKAGQEVVQGDTLLILEAMKMENVLKSPGEGRVKKVLVEKGKAVDKGEVLLEME